MKLTEQLNFYYYRNERVIVGDRGFFILKARNICLRKKIFEIFFFFGRFIFRFLTLVTS